MKIVSFGVHSVLIGWNAGICIAFYIIDKFTASLIVIAFGKVLGYIIQYVVNSFICKYINSLAVCRNIGLPFIHVNKKQKTGIVTSNPIAVIIKIVIGIITGGLALGIIGDNYNSVQSIVIFYSFNTALKI